ncbi:DEAD/DEAH box helicase [Hyphomonas pacifica]|uniref:DEAD/DEAH box helicase n=1 Tax=Hyphomonas pacifica TaxID=1280941 RepID=UPI000DBFADA8|nr:DEAD/DEAH box helicase [Hyphomonas pacifica]RAN32974.1 hypothetical protein HY11_04590 [Hyphomonas pacifica]
MTTAPSIPSALAEALAERGYDTLTQVQTAVIQPDLAGKDLLVSAQTGSGKTVGFGLAMADDLFEGADRFAPAEAPLAIIVAPTRELAQQVARELQWLYGPSGARLATCVGGMDMRDERRALGRGAHIVVGTPGRLADHIRRGSLDTSGIRVVVLDEADEMLDMGFREELEFILQGTPETRRTLMFSATVPKGIAALAGRYQRDAQRITTAAEKEQHVDIDYKALLVAPGDEENAIVNIVRHSDSETALVFCTTRAAVNKLMSRMGNRGFPVVALSGELSQKERGNALQALRDGRARVCIATDVAARGLDLKNLGLVIHADLPRDPATLLHRSGRTGRAGRKGTSVLLVTPRARRRVERLLKDARIEASFGKPPSAEEISAQDDARLMADPIFTEDATSEDANLARILIDTYGAEQVAAAFVRRHRSERTAPEDLREVDDRPPARDRKERGERGERRERSDRSWEDRPPREAREPRERRPREPQPGFENATWIGLNVGRRKNAEARWLLPMLCKAGGLSREDIGAIRINPADTHVELKPDAAKRLFDTIKPDGTLEKGLRAFSLDGAPAPHGGHPDTPEDEAPRRPKPRIQKKPAEAPGKPVMDPLAAFDGDAPPRRKPKKPFDKTKSGGKPFKPAGAHKSARPAHAKSKPGFAKSGPKTGPKSGPKTGKPGKVHRKGPKKPPQD